STALFRSPASHRNCTTVGRAPPDRRNRPPRRGSGTLGGMVQPFASSSPARLVLGIETSCDETGVALYDTHAGLLAHTVHTQVAMHAEYGGVVPELASRDHIRRTLPLIDNVLRESDRQLADLDAVAYTEGPGLAGALLVGASIANARAYGLGIPSVGIHHLEGHLLSPLL